MRDLARSSAACLARALPPSGGETVSKSCRRLPLPAQLRRFPLWHAAGLGFGITLLHLLGEALAIGARPVNDTKNADPGGRPLGVKNFVGGVPSCPRRQVEETPVHRWQPRADPADSAATASCSPTPLRGDASRRRHISARHQREEDVCARCRFSPPAHSRRDISGPQIGLRLVTATAPVVPVICRPTAAKSCSRSIGPICRRATQPGRR